MARSRGPHANRLVGLWVGGCLPLWIGKTGACIYMWVGSCSWQASATPSPGFTPRAARRLMRRVVPTHVTQQEMVR
jgi:hypothetical protein